MLGAGKSLERCSRSGARHCLDLELRNVEAEVFGGSGNWKWFQVESCGSCGSLGVERWEFGSWEFWELGVGSCKMFVVGCWELGIEDCWELEVGSLERCSRSAARQCLDLELRNVEV